MTVTADAPAAAPASESTAPAPVPAGLAAILGSGDHKVIGRLWLVAAMVHLVLVGTVSVLVSAEGIDTSKFDVLGADWIVQADTYRFIGLAFLFLVPLTIAVATVVVPLQVGASTIAFPRAAAASAWTFLIGGGLLIGSYAIHGGPDGTDADGVALFVASFALVLVSLLVAWICIATTVVTLRAPGMGLRRTPLFAWSTLVAGAVWVLTLPALIGLSVISFLDVRYEGFLSGAPGSVYGRIWWAFGTPAVFVMAIPILGFVGSVVPVAFQTRHQQHKVASGLIGAFAVLTVGAWTMPSLSGATPWLYEGPWIVVSIAILVPLVGLLGLWALTARQGRLAFGSPLLFAGVAMVLLFLGGAASAVQAIKPIKTLVDGPGTSLYGTSWSFGIAGFVMLAAITAMIGAVVYWSPKIVGHSFGEGGARLVALLLLVGAVANAGAELIVGLLGQPASAAVGPSEHVSTIEALNLVSTIGVGVLVLAGALFVVLLFKASTSGVATADDPWSGHTLEWATASPPAPGNFASLPKVTSESPLYDARRPEEANA
jgi:heme/copper-type cytochrome/quinol oxidase subunit 1